MAHPSDYKVRERTEQQIANQASRFRQLLDMENDINFDTIKALRRFQEVDITGKGLLKISRFRAPRGVPPARVRYNQDSMTLFVDETVFEEATIGLAEAKFILNHELGHIILHDKSAKAFSQGEESRLKAFPREQRSEWQADTFAFHLSLPYKFIIAWNFDRNAIMNNCNVPMRVVEQQIQSIKFCRNYAGDPCGTCGNFTVVRKVGSAKCDICGNTTD